MQFTSLTVLFVLLFAVQLSIEQSSWPRGGLNEDQNKIRKENYNKKGIELGGIKTMTMVTPKPQVYEPCPMRTSCPIVQCNPDAVLNITGTYLKKIGDAFIDSSNTRELYLDNNGITEFSPMAIATLDALELLSLCENNLTTGNLLWFKEHQTLRKLVIDGNKWRAGDTSIRKTLQSLPKLQELSLRRDHISQFEVSLKKFAPSLSRLDLSGNDIEATDFLADLPGTLSELYLDDNEISKIEENVLNHVTHLSISGNKLNSLCRVCEGDSLNLHGMRVLSTLNASRNKIDEVPDDAFTDTMNLVNLDLSGNGLTSLPKDVFLGLEKLKELRLSSNKLVAVPNVCPLHNLKLLDLSGNVIEAVADLNFCTTMHVETVLLADNHILHVVDNAFLSLPSLKTLDLSKNLIDKLPITLITRSRQLQVLSLKNNKITDIDELFAGSTIQMVAARNTLQKLHLEGNPFVSQKIGYMPYLTILLKEPAEDAKANVTATNSSDTAPNKDEDSDNDSSSSF